MSVIGCRFLAARCTALLACLCVSAVHAELVDPTSIQPGVLGPPTAYGETAQENANKKVVFEWNYESMIQRNPKGAFEQYVSKDYCNHSHLSTGLARDCAGYDYMLAKWIRLFAAPLKPGEKLEYPLQATVNGEMVTMYGQGVDIFRVHGGKIMDHWDATPTRAISFNDHKKIELSELPK